MTTKNCFNKNPHCMGVRKGIAYTHLGSGMIEVPPQWHQNIIHGCCKRKAGEEQSHTATAHRRITGGPPIRETRSLDDREHMWRCILEGRQSQQKRELISLTQDLDISDKACVQAIFMQAASSENRSP